MHGLSKRNYGLDTLRSIAILLVVMSHYTFITGHSVFGPLGNMGGMGVDLFFVLSGYLIGDQIFSGLKKEKFSLKLFYMRRLLRTLPAYFFVLALYCFIPIFKEAPFSIAIWKYVTFTMNFGYKPSAFSQAWSLCIEEQFYLVLPLVALLLGRVMRISFRQGFLIVIAILLAEMAIRAGLWFVFLKDPVGSSGLLQMKWIYAPTFCRLDGLVLGVSLALLKIHGSEKWSRITVDGDLLLWFGILGYGFVAMVFQTAAFNQFFSIVINYSLLSFSSAALVLAALSDTSFLSRIKIPGMQALATLSYSIYLTHKSLLHLLYQIVTSHASLNADWIMLIASCVVLLSAAGVVYICIERPFLRLRETIQNRQFATIEK